MKSNQTWFRVTMKSNQTWFRIVAYSGFTGLIGKAGQFLGLIILALVLSSDNYGRFAIAQIVSTGFISIVSSSFGMAASKKFAKSSISDSKLIVALAIFTFRKHLIIVAFVALFIVPLLYFKLSGESLQVWVIPWAILTISTVLVDIISGSLAGSGAVRSAGLLDAFRFLAVGVFTLSAGSLFGWVGAVFGLLLFDFLLSVAFIINAWRERKRIDFNIELGLDGESSKTVGAGVISNGVTQLASWTLTWAIQSIFGLSAVGAFSVASRFTSLILIVPGLISRNSLGYLARQQNTDNPSAYVKAILSYLAIILSAVTVAALVVILMVTLFFSSFAEEYATLPEIFRVLLVAMAVRASATGLGVICVSWGMFRLWVLSDILSALASIGWISIAILKEASIEVLIIGSVLSAGIAFLIRFFFIVKRLLALAKS